MRLSILLIAITSCSLSTCTESPFHHPLRDETHGKRADEILQLLKRQGSCPAGYSACSAQGNSGVCCQPGMTCTQDNANNIACCPTGAVKCTGSLGATAGSQPTNSGFMFPQTTAATTTTSPAAGAVITGSTVAGAAYPFIYIPTAFANGQTCSSYYSFCQSEYASCTASLGGAYGVTVAGGGAGVTVAGAPGVTGAAAAQSICSSLSFQACYGLQIGYCAGLGTASAAGARFVNAGSGPVRRSSLHDLTIGLAAAIAGMFI
ncbi:hypothetical protein V8E54_012085 [Elaphomyces granulatus]